MARTFSLAHLTLQGCSLGEYIEIAARTGYDHVSLRMTKVCPSDRVYPLITDHKLRRETGIHIKDAGLSVLDVELILLDRKAEPQTFEPLLAASAELGAGSIIVQIPDPDRQRALDKYARLCDLAKPYGLFVALEFVSWTQTPDLRSAASLVRNSGRSNGGLLVDMLHFDRSNSEITELRNLPSEWFRFIHLCDAPAATPSLTEGIINTARTARLFPGHGDLAIGEVLQCLPEVPCSLEIPNESLLKTLGHEEYARQALSAAKKYIYSLVNPNCKSRFATQKTAMQAGQPI